MQTVARRRWSVALAALIVTAATAGLVRTFATNWAEVRDALHDANWWLLAGAGAGAFVAVAFVAQRWHATLWALGAHVPLVDAVRWFMTGQMGKYAPGGVLQVVGQGELAARGGVPRRAAYASVLLSTVVLLGGAALVVAGGAALPSTTTPWWAVGVGAAVTAVFLEPHLRRLLLTKAGVHESSGGLAPRRLLALVLGGVPAWLTIGMSTWLVARAFSPHIGIAPIVVAAVASWLVGIVTLPAPGGIGVREAVLAAALRDDLGAGTATLVALTARMVFLAADLGWFVLVRLPRAASAETSASENSENIEAGEISEAEPQP